MPLLQQLRVLGSEILPTHGFFGGVFVTQWAFSKTSFEIAAEVGSALVAEEAAHFIHAQRTREQGRGVVHAKLEKEVVDRALARGTEMPLYLAQAYPEERCHSVT
jgi:hypothetical protein